MTAEPWRQRFLGCFTWSQGWLTLRIVTQDCDTKTASQFSSGGPALVAFHPRYRVILKTQSGLRSQQSRLIKSRGLGSTKHCAQVQKKWKTPGAWGWKVSGFWKPQAPCTMVMCIISTFPVNVLTTQTSQSVWQRSRWRSRRKNPSSSTAVVS